MGAHVLPAGGWRIHNYATPEPVIMGFEYEIDTGHRGPDTLTTLLNNKLPKHYSWCYEGLGGSLGAEIKSSVAPLRTLKHEIKTLLPILQEYTPKEHERNTGGIHVNISRTELTNRKHNIVFSFLHDPSVWRSLCCVISGRNGADMGNNAMSINPTHNWLRWDYYNGIITTRKRYAFELRMFKAKPHLLLPAVEFAHAIFDLALVEDGPELTIENLTRHVNHFDRYSNIAELMAKHGFTVPRTTRKAA